MRNRLSIVVAGAIVAVLLLKMMVYTVKESEVAVMLTFGKPSSEKDTPGLKAKWPWPIQKVKVFDARLRVLKAPLEEMVTNDGRAILVGSFVVWRIKSAQRFQERLGEVAVAERLLETFLRNHQAAAISATPFGGLVSTRREELRYEQVEQRMLGGVKKDAEEMGLEVSMVGIRRLGLPEGATEAVFERMKEDRQVLATDILEQGRSEANQIKNRADQDRADTIRLAEIEARRILGKADEQAEPYYKKLAEDPGLAIYLKKLVALEKSLDGETALILTTRQPPFDLLERASIAPVGS